MAKKDSFEQLLPESILFDQNRHFWAAFVKTKPFRPKPRFWPAFAILSKTRNFEEPLRKLSYFGQNCCFERLSPKYSHFGQTTQFCAAFAKTELFWTKPLFWAAFPKIKPFWRKNTVLIGFSPKKAISVKTLNLEQRFLNWSHVGENRCFTQVLPKKKFSKNTQFWAARSHLNKVCNSTLFDRLLNLTHLDLDLFIYLTHFDQFAILSHSNWFIDFTNSGQCVILKHLD